MARVPYTPVPDVSPQAPGEQISIATPGAAFGENIGAALKQLGGSVETAGNELFTRAIAMQELRNQNEAREAQTDFATESSKLHAEFNARTGKDAVDHLDEYLQSQATLRKQIGSRLSSPMARQYYDADSLPFMQRNVFSAAGHAADQNKKYTIDTLKATSDINVNEIGNNPHDQGLFDQKLAQLTQDTVHATMLQAGVDENSPIVRDAVLHATSKITTSRILGINKTDPALAQQWYEKYGSSLTDDDKLRIEGTIQGRSAAVFAANFATNFYKQHLQPDGTLDITNEQAKEEIRAEATKQLPGNPFAAEQAVTKWDSIIFHDNIARTQDKRETINSIDQAIQQFNVTDTQQLLALPGMDVQMRKLAQLDPTLARGMQKHIFDLNLAANVITRDSSLRVINGIKSSGAIDEYLSLDPSDPKWHLNISDIKQIQKDQLQLQKDPKDDPRVMHAMTLLRGGRGTELEALQITSARQNSDDYYHFVGSLQEALQEWQEVHKHPPSAEEIVDKIGPQIIRTQAAVKHWWRPDSQEPAFQQFTRPNVEDVPPEFTTKVTRDVVEKGGAEPTQEQILRAYTRMQFQKLFGSSGGEGGPAAPASR